MPRKPLFQKPPSLPGILLRSTGVFAGAALCGFPLIGLTMVNAYFIWLPGTVLLLILLFLGLFVLMQQVDGLACHLRLRCPPLMAVTLAFLIGGVVVIGYLAMVLVSVFMASVVFSFA